MFLDAVSRAHRAKGVPLPIFVLTDADPHGIHIAYCYIRDLPDCHFRWIGVRPSDQGSLFQVHESALLPVTPAESVLLESLLQRLSSCAINETESLAPLIAELNVLKSTGKKFEIEAIACKDFGADMSGLLRYLLDRT